MLSIKTKRMYWTPQQEDIQQTFNCIDHVDYYPELCSLIPGERRWPVTERHADLQLKQHGQGHAAEHQNWLFALGY